MKLTQEDGKLFYKMWFPLLDYVNEKKKVNRNLKDMAHAEMLDPMEVMEVADALWEDVKIIDEYIEKKRKNLTEEEVEIIRSWKRRVRGQFFLERHLKKGAVLIYEDEEVYLVSGIISSLDEMFYGAPLPLMMEATLIPFRDVIITDGLVMPYNIIIGSNAKRMFKDTYMNAKTKGKIHKSL